MKRKFLALLFVMISITGMVYSAGKSSDKVLQQFESAYLHAPALKLKVDLPALEAERDLLAARLDSLYREQDKIQNGAVSLSYRVLSLFSFTIYERVVTAYSDKNLKKFLKHAADFTELAEDLDRLAALAGDRHIPRNQQARHLLVWKDWLEALHTSLLTQTTVDPVPYQLRFEKLKSPKPHRRQRPETAVSFSVAQLLFEKYKFHLVKNYLSTLN